MKKKTTFFLLFLVFLTFFSTPQFAFAGKTEALLYRGTARIMNAPFQIPNKMVLRTRQHGLPGILTGMIEGTMHMVGGVVFGALDVALGAAPLAKYAVFFA